MKRAREHGVLCWLLVALASGCRATPPPGAAPDAASIALAVDAGQTNAVTREIVRLPDGGQAEVTTKLLGGGYAFRQWSAGGHVFRSEGFYGAHLGMETEISEGREDERMYDEDGGLWLRRVTTFAPSRRVQITTMQAGRPDSRHVETDLADGGLEIVSEAPLPDGGWQRLTRRVRSRATPEY